MWSRLGLLSLVLAWLSCFGCRGCTGADAMAILTQKAGLVDRDFGREREAWKDAEVGAKFGLGDGIQTRSDATAVVKLDDGSFLSMEPDTLIRFSKSPPKGEEVGFDVEMGAASVEVGSQQLALVTSLGMARLEAGSTVRLVSSDRGLRFLVRVGKAVFGDTPVGQGQSILVDLGGVVIEDALEVESVEEPGPVVEPEGSVRAQVSGKTAQVLGPDGWESLAEGTTDLDPGTELELGKKTRVLLQRGKRSATLTRKGRYQIAPERGILVSTETGTVTAGGEDLVRVGVPGGVIVVAPAGRARMTATTDGTRVEVQQRTALVRTREGEQKLSAGQEATVAPGGEIESKGLGLPYADLDLVAGESVVVHDPSPPTAVRFFFEEACPGSGIVRLKKGRRVLDYAAGDKRVSLGLRRGDFAYQLRCLEGGGKLSKVVRRGSVRVVRDRGTRGMAARAPVTKLVADGRSYTVLYQNRLPTVELSWPSAPEVEVLKLFHQAPRKKQKTLELSEAHHRFGSGQLREGAHVFHFEAEGKISRRTTVTIGFDNAAPTASLSTPPVLAAAPGERVAVAGIALPGWNVSVDGHPARTDRHGRFSASAELPIDRRALAVSISHPRRGTHVYLRRGATP